MDDLSKNFEDTSLDKVGFIKRNNSTIREPSNLRDIKNIILFRNRFLSSYVIEQGREKTNYTNLVLKTYEANIAITIRAAPEFISLHYDSGIWSIKENNLNSVVMLFVDAIDRIETQKAKYRAVKVISYYLKKTAHHILNMEEDEILKYIASTFRVIVRDLNRKLTCREVDQIYAPRPIPSYP